MMAITIGVLSVLQIGTARYMINQADENAGSIVGTQLATLLDVMNAYLVKNNTQLQSLLPVVSGVADPMAPTVSELKTLGMTATTFSQSPFLGGAYVMKVEKSPAGCVAPNCNLRGKIWLQNPILHRDTGTPSLRILGAAAASGKGAVGFSLPATKTLITGPAGWSEPNPDAAQREGILMAAVAYDESGLSEYIKRDGTQPVTADFPMTGLDGVKHSITGAKNITASDTITSNFVQLEGVVVDGSPCPKNGVLGRDSNGAPLSCQSLVWKKGGGLPFPAYKCPMNGSTPPGQWATWGCVGQISSYSYCENFAYGGGSYYYSCTPIN